MIVLDTNVVSEPMKAGTNGSVAAWLDRQEIGNLYLTTITLAELWMGLELLALGRRRSALEAKIGDVIALFGPRLLPFEVRSARVFAILIGRARAAGHAVSMADGQIAAIASAHGFAVATRDTGPFIAAGVPVLDPWSAP